MYSTKYVTVVTFCIIIIAYSGDSKDHTWESPIFKQGNGMLEFKFNDGI